MTDVAEIGDAITIRDALREVTQDTRNPASTAHANQLTYTGEYLNESASEDIRFLLRNPAGSERTCTIYGITGYQDVQDVVFMEVLKNPDTDLPTTEQNIMKQSQGLGETPSEMTWLADEGVQMSGGNTGTHLRLDDGRVLQYLHSLAPGESLGGTTTTGGGLFTDATIHAGLFWFEEPI